MCWDRFEIVASIFIVLVEPVFVLRASAPLRVRARAHTHSHIHTLTRAHTHTHTHLRTHSRTHSRTHARTCKPNTARKTKQKQKCTIDCNQLQLISKQILLLLPVDSSEPSVVMVKFLDDTYTLEGLFEISDESAYRGQIGRLAGWCSENDLELNVSRTKEMVIDFRKKKTSLVPLTVAGEVAEVKTFKFPGTTISSDLKWDENISAAIKKAHQRLFFLRQLKKFFQSFHTDSVLLRCN